MDEKIKDVLRLAVLIVEQRGGDINTEDGYVATTDTDVIIGLDQALCEAFETSSDDARIQEIGPKIDAL